MYINLNEAEHLHFSNCDTCTKSCCDGRRFVLAPLIMDDVEEVYEKFLIAFAFIDGQLRMLMVISNKFSPCMYYKNNQCTIYDTRPPACKLYPYTPYFEEILIDTQCEAVGEVGIPMVVNGTLLDSFKHKRLENFRDKLDDTQFYLYNLGHQFRPLIEIEGVMLLEYTGEVDDAFIQMHKTSLAHVGHWR